MTEPPVIHPWDLHVIPGNFHVNGVQLVTHQIDGSLSHVTDYVLRSDLPGSAMTTFSTNAYVPMDPSNTIRLTGLNVDILREDQTRTGNLFSGGGFLYETTMSGQLYAVFRIDATYSTGPTLTRDTFRSMRFQYTVTHESASGTVHNTRPMTFEIQKRLAH